MLGSLIPLAQEGGGQTGSNPASLLIFLVLMFVLFYFLMIRPQQRRARAQRDLLSGLDVGDEVVTIGGMFGIVQSLDDESVTVEVSPEVEIRFLKSAIARRISPVEDAEYEEDQEGEEVLEEGPEAEGAGEKR